MGRAAAAGTGLLANVVAGVGSAIGASRTGTAEGKYLADVGIGGGGGTGERRNSTSHGAAPLVQLYRRTDDADEAAAPAGPATASARVNRSSYSSTSCAIGVPDGDLPATTVDTNSVVGGAVAGKSVLSSTGRKLPGTIPPGRDDSTGGNAFTGDATADIWGGGGGDGTERRSALGMASATSGAVLRGLWGGVQSAAAAGAAVAAQVGAGADERAVGDGGVGGGTSGGGNSEPPAPEFRLYRREEDI